MAPGNHACLVELSSLRWPLDLSIPLRRFRLLVAADSTNRERHILSDFACRALRRGMVHFSVWGPGCERFHDMVHEAIVRDELTERRFTGPNPRDTAKTTWHAKDTLDETLDHFLGSARPADGLAAESDYWLAVCVDQPAWSAVIRERLRAHAPRQNFPQATSPSVRRRRALIGAEDALQG